jgi:hypothetical protein
MIRKAKAVWRGTDRDDSGNLCTISGVLVETPYSFRTRCENERGTNPEELIAARASCGPRRLPGLSAGAEMSTNFGQGPLRPSCPKAKPTRGQQSDDQHDNNRAVGATWPLECRFEDD